jgi:hypothetical protein
MRWNISHVILSGHPFLKERMTYIPADQSPESKAWVIYQSKDGKTIKTFHALDWLAQLTTHVPNKIVYDDTYSLSPSF